MTTPFRYQIQAAVNVDKFHGRALLAMDPGLGKSFTSLLWYNWNREITTPLLVICPASLKLNWQREIRTHLNERSQILEGSKPDPVIQELDKQVSNVWIINYDILGGWLDFIESLKPRMVVIDESQYVVNRSAKRSKCVRAICKNVPHVLALSGTPLVNRPAELWNVLNLLRPDLYPRFWPFAEAYCDPKLTPWGWQYQGATNMPQLHKELKKSVMIRYRKADVLKDLPPKQKIIVPLEITNRKEYTKAVNSFLLWLTEKSPLLAARARKAEKLTKIGYLKRLAAQLKLKNAFTWLDDLMTETDGKIVVFAIHKNIVETLTKRYRRKCVTINGSTPVRDRMRRVDQFMKNPKTRLFIGNIRAAGTGLNLTASNTVVFFEMGWTPGEHVQAEDRCHRIGTEGTTTCYYLVSHDSIEVKIAQLISDKQQILDSVLDGKSRRRSVSIQNQLLQEMENLARGVERGN